MNACLLRHLRKPDEARAGEKTLQASCTLRVEDCKGPEAGQTARSAAITNGKAGAQGVVLKEMTRGEGGKGWA